MKRFFFITLLSLDLMSSTLTELTKEYRTHGINAIIERFNQTMATKEFWDDYLQSTTPTWGYFEENRTLLLASKNKKEMSVWECSFVQCHKKETFSVITGKNEGDKEREGDLKTPIGVYELSEKKLPPPFYGPLAFVTTYPNTHDTIRGKNGHGIWIHGLPLDASKRDDETRGCLALNNAQLVKLASLIDYQKSLVLIDDNPLDKVTTTELSLLLESLFRWRQAWLSNDIDGYLSFYAENFKRHDGLNFERFKSLKGNVFAKKETKEIAFSSIVITRAPSSSQKGLYRITFTERYNSASHKFEGSKELFVTLASQKMKIITEK